MGEEKISTCEIGKREGLLRSLSSPSARESCHQEQESAYLGRETSKNEERCKGEVQR